MIIVSAKLFPFALSLSKGACRRANNLAGALRQAQGERIDKLRANGDSEAHGRKDDHRLKSDERILGDGDHVSEIPSRSKESFGRRYALKAGGIDMDFVAQRVAALLGIDAEDIWCQERQKSLCGLEACFASGPYVNWATLWLPWWEKRPRKTGSFLPRWHQDRPIAVGLHGADQAGGLHLLDEAGGAVVADPQLALNGGDRGAAGVDHEGDGIVV